MSINKLRKDFPIFRDKKLIYLDNASTTQKPQCVIDAISNFYSKYNANAKANLKLNFIIYFFNFYLYL